MIYNGSQPPPHKSYFLNLAMTRKTTYEFTNRKVKYTDIKKILEAGRWAPSCSDSQPWHFIIVKDKETIKKLMTTANYGDFHLDPPLMIALVLIKEKCDGHGFACFRGVASGVHDSYMSIGMVALNMTLEARELGIDSCLITPKQDIAKKILKIDKEDAIPLIVGFGYQNGKAFQKKRERHGLSDITSFEFFGGKK